MQLAAWRRPCWTWIDGARGDPCWHLFDCCRPAIKFPHSHTIGAVASSADSDAALRWDAASSETTYGDYYYLPVHYH